MVKKRRFGFLLLMIALLVLFAGCYRMNLDTLWRTGVTADGDPVPGAEPALPAIFHPGGDDEGGKDNGAVPGDETGSIGDEPGETPGMPLPDAGEAEEAEEPDKAGNAPGTTPDRSDDSSEIGTDVGEHPKGADLDDPSKGAPGADPSEGSPDDLDSYVPENPPQEPGTKPADSADGKEPIKRVALTFDDGPDKVYTSKVLDILHEYGVPGTFFLVGTQVEKFPDTAKRIVDEGHSIGNHSWNHADLSKLSAAAIREQISKADEAMKQATGVVPSLFRAPYGAVSKTLKAELNKLGRELVGWTVDPRDWAGTSVAAMRKNVNETVRPDGVILLHSFGGKNGDLTNTLELLPLIIADLHDKGYVFVTIDELLEDS